MSLEKIIDFIVYVGFLLMLINLFLYLKKFSKLDKALKIYSIYLMLIALVQGVTTYLSSKHLNNLFVSHFYFIIQFVVLSFFYFNIISNKFQQKVIRHCLLICLVVLAIQYYFDISIFYKFNPLEIFITSFLILIYAMFHFYNILNESKKYYYLNTGIFVYLFASTVLFLSGNVLNTLHPSVMIAVWGLNNLLYIVYQIYIFVEWKKTFSNNG